MDDARFWSGFHQAQAAYDAMEAPSTDGPPEELACDYCGRDIHRDDMLTSTAIGDLCDLCRGDYERGDIEPDMRNRTSTPVFREDE